MNEPPTPTPELPRAARLRALPVETVWLVVPLLLLLLHGDFVPIWDGRAYFEGCLYPSIQNGSWLGLNCFGHKSMAYMSWLALFQLPDPGNHLLLHIANGLLLGVAVFHFSRLSARLFDGDDGRLPRFLLTGIFAVSPAVLGSAINPAPDVGVLVFSVCTLLAFVAERFVLATLWGACLVLSKESGVLTFAAFAASYVLVIVLGRPASERMRELRRSAPALLVPPFALALVTLLQMRQGAPAVWGQSMDLAGLLDAFLTLRLLDPVFLRYSADILVLNFHWVLGVFLITFVLSSAGRALLGLPQPQPTSRERRFVLIAGALCFYLITRYRTFNNVRYLLPLLPLAYLASYHALCWLGTSVRARAAILAFMLGGAFLSNFRTIDPLSMGLFGTFRFGQHSLLRMDADEPFMASGFRHFGYGYGRDQLTYSLEFTRLHDVQNALLRQIDLDQPPLLVFSDHADYYLIGPIDRETHARTLRRQGAIMLPTSDLTPFLKAQPAVPHALFVAYPNYDPELDLRRLGERYNVSAPRYVGDDGYVMGVYELRAR